MKKALIKLSILWDKIRDFLISVLITILIIIVILCLVHNVIKIIQISNKYEGKYQNFVEADNGDIINVQEYGNGEKTIVILSGYGIQVPSIFYKNLAMELSNTYRVVILEYPGYGFTKNTENERDNENLANDIKQALEKAEISGPYILMPHSISNLYAMKFIEMYPELVESVISIDGVYPQEVANEDGKENIKNTCINTKISSILECTGFARILSYAKPDLYGLDTMKEDSNISDEDVKLYRKMIATNYLTKNMREEINDLESNMNEMVDFKYPDNLPVLEVLATETVDSYDEKYEKNKLSKMANAVISNNEIQKVVQIQGSHLLNMTNPEDLTSETIKFIDN